MENKIVKRPVKKPESLAQRVITLEQQVIVLQKQALKLEKQIGRLKAKKTASKKKRIPDVGLMQMVVEASKKIEHDEPPIK